MKIITPSVELMRTGLETEMITPEQFIEKVGRTCYKSEDKITDDSAAKFVGNLIKRGHEAMIEHWSLIFTMDFHTYDELLSVWHDLLHNGNIPTEDRMRPYLRFSDSILESGEPRYLVSGNMRAWRDFIKAYTSDYGFIPHYLFGLIRNYPLFFPEYQDYVPAVINNYFLLPISVSELDEYERNIHQDVTFKFICDRGVSHEIVRHRVASFAQESTRYCNYSGEKFDKCITVVEPHFVKEAYFSEKHDIIHEWERACTEAESHYFRLLDMGCTPQEARSVLPNSLKTEVIVTMNLDGWKHFFGLRCAPTAHPDMQEVAKMALGLFEAELYSDIFEEDEDNLVGCSDATE